jgi:hypothetical protein
MFSLYFLRRLIKYEPKKLLGRWIIEKCQKRTRRKIDLANIDHCGTCGDVHGISLSPKTLPSYARVGDEGSPSRIILK